MNSSLSLRRFATLSLVGLSLSACGGGRSGPDDQSSVNQPPVVTVKPGSTETFELLATSVGVEASDPDGDPLTYEWKQAAGTPVDMGSGKEATFSFSAPKVAGNETLSFTVSVSDGTDTVKKNIDLLVKEAETVVMLAGLAQNNALEAFRRHVVDGGPVHLDAPLGTIPPGDFADAFGLQLSPDRKRAAWLDDHDLDGGYELKVVEIAGNGTRSLTPNLDPAADENILEFKWSPDSQSIAYLKHSEPVGVQLFVVDVASKDGSDARLMSGETTYSDGDPANGALDGSIDQFDWSPSGDRIAFIGRVRVEQGLLYISNVGTGQRMEMDLAELGGLQDSVGSFDWAPDGTRLVMTERIEDIDNESIALLNAVDGTWQKLVTSADPVDRFFFDYQPPAFSPNGKYIAFLARADGEIAARLYVVTPDKAAFNRVSGTTAQPNSSGGSVRGYRWSPDSRQLAFVGQVETETVKELFVVAATSADGSNRRKISGAIPDVNPADGTPDGDVDESDFSWSPDGKQIAFVGRDFKGANNKEVFVVGANGNGDDRRHVSGASTDDSGDGVPDSWFDAVKWSPTGTHLYFTGNIQGDDENELFKVGADSTDGGDRVSVSGPPASGGGHVWEYDVGGPAN